MEIIEFFRTKLMHILNRESFHPPKIKQNLAVIHYRNFFLETTGKLSFRLVPRMAYTWRLCQKVVPFVNGIILYQKMNFLDINLSLIKSCFKIFLCSVLIPN